MTSSPKEKIGPDDSLDDLAFAAAHGRVNIVKALLDQGVQVNRKVGVFRDTTALMLATVADHSEIVMLLVNKGADVEAKDNAGVTALMRAASLGYVKTVKALVDGGADVNSRDVTGTTPLMWAVMSYCTAVVKILLDAGADVNARNENGDTALSKALHGRPHTLTVGGSEFSVALSKSHNDIVRMFEEAGATR